MEVDLNVQENVWHMASAGDLSIMPAMVVAGYMHITGTKQLLPLDPAFMNTSHKSDQLFINSNNSFRWITPQL